MNLFRKADAQPATVEQVREAILEALAEPVAVEALAESGLPFRRTVLCHLGAGPTELCWVGILTGIYEDAFVLNPARTVPGGEAIEGGVIVPRNLPGVPVWFQDRVPESLLEQ